MRKFVYRFITVAVLLLLATGCASTRQNVPFPNQFEAVGSDQTRIYVVRPTAIGGAVPMKVMDGNLLIGQTGPNSYLCWDRKPGAISITGKAENKAVLNFQTEGGRIYYVQQHVRMGILYARNKLTLLNEPEGKSLVSKCSPPKQ